MLRDGASMNELQDDLPALSLDCLDDPLPPHLLSIVHKPRLTGITLRPFFISKGPFRNDEAITTAGKTGIVFRHVLRRHTVCAGAGT